MHIPAQSRSPRRKAAINGRTPKRRGFTLVELMVVVLIIGILAGLISGAGFMAMRSARQAKVVSEMEQLRVALDGLQRDLGQYPPDFAGVNHSDSAARQAARNAVIAYLAKRWPRYRPGYLSGSTDKDPFVRFAADVAAGSGVNVYNLTPATALVFWVGGPPDWRAGASRKLMGFCADETNPFNPAGSRAASPFEFDETRLQRDPNDPADPKDPASSNGLVYLPATSAAGDDAPAPYVYFRSRLGAYTWYWNNDPALPFQVWKWTKELDPSGQPVLVRPYANVGRGGWFEPQRYQLVCAGLDGLYGAKYQLPLDQGTETFTGPEEDNLASFTTGKLGDLSE